MDPNSSVQPSLQSPSLTQTQTQTIQAEPQKTSNPFKKIFVILVVLILILVAAAAPVYFLAKGNVTDFQSLIFWQKSERAIQANKQSEFPKLDSNNALINTNTPIENQLVKVLEVSLQVDKSSKPIIKISSLSAPLKDIPQITKDGDYVLKVLGNGNAVLVETKFSLKDTIQKEDISIVVPYVDGISSVQVLDGQGKIIDSKSFVQIITKGRGTPWLLLKQIENLLSMFKIKEAYAVKEACAGTMGWGANGKTIFQLCCGKVTTDVEGLVWNLQQAGYKGSYSAFEAMDLYQQKYCPEVSGSTGSTARNDGNDNDKWDICGKILTIKEMRDRMTKDGWDWERSGGIVHSYHTAYCPVSYTRNSRFYERYSGSSTSSSSDIVISLCVNTTKAVSFPESNLRNQLKNVSGVGYKESWDINKLKQVYESINCPARATPSPSPAARVASPKPSVVAVASQAPSSRPTVSQAPSIRPTVSQVPSSRPVVSQAPSSRPVVSSLPSPQGSPKVNATSNKCGPIQSITIDGENRDSKPISAADVARGVSIEIVVTCHDGSIKRQIINLSAKSKTNPAAVEQSTQPNTAVCLPGCCGDPCGGCPEGEACTEDNGACPGPSQKSCKKIEQTSDQPSQPGQPTFCEWTQKDPECDWGAKQVYEVWCDCNGKCEHREQHTQIGVCGAEQPQEPDQGNGGGNTCEPHSEDLGGGKYKEIFADCNSEVKCFNGRDPNNNCECTPHSDDNNDGTYTETFADCTTEVKSF